MCHFYQFYGNNKQIRHQIMVKWSTKAYSGKYMANKTIKFPNLYRIQ